MFQCFHEIQKIASFFKIQSWPFSFPYTVLWHSAWQWIISLHVGWGNPKHRSHHRRPFGAVKHGFPFRNACWLFPATSLSLMCFEMFSSSIYSIIFPGTEVNLTDLLFPGPFFLSSLKTGATFAFSQCLRTSQHHNISKTIRSDIRLPSTNSHCTCRCIYQVPWICMCLVPEGELQL